MEFTLHILVIFLAVVTTAAPIHAAPALRDHIHLLMPHSGSAGHKVAGIDCLSWRLSVEAHNLINWKLVPASCEDYIGHYMLGKQYRDDCEAVAEAAADYAATVNITGDGKDIWVFDIDETTLSNMPYYARSDVAFGSKPYNDTKFNLWVAEGLAPAVPGAVKLYKKLVKLGFKIVFLSGTNAAFYDVRIHNLKAVGYSTWEKLILKGGSDHGLSAVAYKSKRRKELEDGGYRIQGNMGDQWSDILGTNVGARTFKVGGRESNFVSGVLVEEKRRTYHIVGSMGDQWSDLIGTHVRELTFKMPNPMYYVG